MNSISERIRTAFQKKNSRPDGRIRASFTSSICANAPLQKPKRKRFPKVIVILQAALSVESTASPER